MIVAVILAYSLQARAADSKCSIDSLSLCKVYDDASAKIEYPDKTFIPNLTTLARPANVNLAALDKAAVDRSNADVDAHTEKSVKAFMILMAVRPALSAEFVYYASGHLRQLGWMLDGDETTLPWPPAGVSKMKKLKKGDASDFIASLPEDQKKQLAAITDQEADQTLNEKSRVAGVFSESGKQLITEMNTVTDERYKHVEVLFDEMKKNVEDVIRKGRTDAQLTPQEKAAVAKVDSIRMNHYRGDVRENSSCLGIEVKACYSSTSHSVSLCPNVLNYPDATLAMTIGHELGHSIDACFSQTGFFKINEALAKHLIDDPGVRSDNLKYHAVDTALDDSTNGVSASFLARDLTAAQMSYLTDSGILKRQTADVPFRDYVLKDVYECLVSSKGGAFRAQSKEEVQKSISEVIARRTKTRGPTYNAAEDRAKLEYALSESPECTMTNNSQMQEVMADWIGQASQDRYLQAHQLTVAAKTPKDLMALVGVPASFACGDRLQVQANPDRDSTVAWIAFGATSDLKSAKDSHPVGIKRVEELMLRDPVLRAALGCPTDSPQPRCEHKISTPLPAADAATVSTPATSPASSTGSVK